MPSLSSLTLSRPSPKDDHRPFHHPHHFEFATVRSVPDSHAWPDLYDHPVAAAAPDFTIPVIDLSSPAAASLVPSACESWGAFQVTHHGVPPALLARLESAARSLFSLPTHRKLRAARSPGSISGYGLAAISPFFSKLMWSEGFTISGDPFPHAQTLWPHHPHPFCEVIEEYNQEMNRLAGRLVQLMLRSLPTDQPAAANAFQDLAGVLQLNSYPACPDPDRAIGLAPHTDSSLLTVLYQSAGTCGLQVLRGPGDCGPARWASVPPVPGALVVNVGDLFHVLSNGRFKSVLHRAVVSRAHHRISAAYICGPPPSVQVAPICRPGAGPRFRAVTWPDYLGLKRKLFDKALASIKLSEDDQSTNNIN